MLLPLYGVQSVLPAVTLLLASCLTLAHADSCATETPGVIHCAAEGTWARTRCGSPASPGTDIITEHGRQVSPDNVKRIFGYPRPSMTRPQWHSLNGLWEFSPATEGQRPPFGKTLPERVLVPFPVESCLSGLKNQSNGLNVPPTYQHMFYRTMFNGRAALSENPGGEVLLHFGAVDWQSDVYVNGLWVGSHEGGYDAFSLVITAAIGSAGQDEIVVQVYDPSNQGSQPFGKQRTSAMYSPAGDTYTSVSGIWQPVWLESVPREHITGLKVYADMENLNINVLTSIPDAGEVKIEVAASGDVVASNTCIANIPCSLKVPSPHLWSPEDPFLYNMTVSYKADAVGSYFGMRKVSLCKDPKGIRRPCINMKYRFLAGVLDQESVVLPTS